jgi:hypothetical protein
VVSFIFYTPPEYATISFRNLPSSSTTIAYTFIQDSCTSAAVAADPTQAQPITHPIEASNVSLSSKDAVLLLVDAIKTKKDVRSRRWALGDPTKPRHIAAAPLAYKF